MFLKQECKESLHVSVVSPVVEASVPVEYIVLVNPTGWTNVITVNTAALSEHSQQKRIIAVHRDVQSMIRSSYVKTSIQKFVE